MWNKTKATAKKLIKNLVTYGCMIIVAATLLDLALYTASYKAIMAVQLPHSCPTATTTAKVATTTKAIVAPVQKGTIREVTAYNLGDVAQNDQSPCITASGQNGCELVEQGISICAANFVPLNTKIHIENFGECLVIDRMAKRFTNRVDIGMKLSEKDRAIKFGRQHLAVTIIE